MQFYCSNMDQVDEYFSSAGFDIVNNSYSCISSGIAAGFNTLGTAFFPLVFLCLLMSQMYKQEEVNADTFLSQIFMNCVMIH